MATEAPLKLKTPNVSLDAAGLVALVDLTTIQQRTALSGTAVVLDMLVICPGIHTQQESVSLNGGEYPACAALTTGYVFRVENPATVHYLQKVGRTGQLTTLSVSSIDTEGPWYTKIAPMFFSYHNATMAASLAYTAAVLWGIVVLILLGLTHDWWALGVVLILMFSRACNIVIIRRRSICDWSGAPEPGVQGDLLILLSQDRWIRMRGAVDDLKKVTSGQWLRDGKHFEGWITAVAAVLVYLGAALASNAQQLGKILLICLLIGSVGLLAIANVTTTELQMHGNIVKVVGERKKYARRLELANELIKETKSDDWAIRMGLINKKSEPSVVM